jgi:phosphoribosylamine--glycine ligase
VRILVVGGGAREHALCWRLRQDGNDVWVAPGNPGMVAVATRVAATPTDAAALLDLIRREGIELTVIGPEAPLVAGVADRLAEGGAAVLGPSAAAAQIEASKSWAMAFCGRHGIPAPQATQCRDPGEAVARARSCPLPVVVKADGLMAGKGVCIAHGRDEAVAAARTLSAHGPVVFEEFLEGREVSAFALCDGRRGLLYGIARDHKRLLDGDRGPMTGGMGAFAPVPDVDEATESAIRRLLEATVAALADEGRPFVGFLFAGLMLTAEGPRVLEFNCRFGDPEAQSVLPLMQGDLAAQWIRAARGDLRPDERVRFARAVALGVVLAAPGYPDAPQPGQQIPGLDPHGQLAAHPAALVFHAATAYQEGAWRTAGGRVLTVVGRGPDLDAARPPADAPARAAEFPGAQLRRDMGRVREG